MIYQDVDGYPVNTTGDGGDSSMRLGMALLTSTEFQGWPVLESYEISYGMLTRHPKQTPWNNRLNFTRDQLIPLLAGYNKIGRQDIIRRVLLMQILRFGFCQDFQRDIVGSWKKPWPNTYMNDGAMTTKLFDFADPTLPNDWWCLIRGARFYPFYLLYPLCFLFTLVAIYGSRSHQEQNQMVAELSFYPRFMMRLYVKYGGWKNGINNYLYWQDRNELEYAESIANYVGEKTK